ncbi:MAG TPA: hypothetical protein VIW03_10990 [Anaeromyxobacter sp.]
MTSRAGQLIASPTWGGARKRAGGRRLEAIRAVHFPLRGSAAADAAGAALVLGASFALWAAFLAAVW